MPAAVVIALKDLRQRYRDRSAIILGFVAPILIATLMSLAFGKTEHFHATVGLVELDRTHLSKAFASVVTSDELRDVLTVKRYGSERAVAAAVRSHRVDAAFVVPAGFGDAAAGASPESVSVLTSVDRALAGEVGKAVASSFVAQLNADRLSVASAIAAGAPPDRLEQIVSDATSLRLPLDVVTRPSGDRTLEPVSYFGPGMAIFFVLFSVGFTARNYFVEQREGTLERITSATGPGQVLAGKALSSVAHSVACLATMAIFTTTVFGADWGGWGPAMLVCGAMVVAILALTALVIAVSRSERQAEGFASMITFGLALLGGSFVFLSAAPPLMRRLALATPNGWAMRAFTDLATGPHSISVAAGPAAAILVFAAATASLAVLIFRRRLAAS